MQGVKRLPALQGVVNQVHGTNCCPRFLHPGGTGGRVSLDSGVTANVLRKANSAFFSLERKVATLGQALVRIGVENLINITLNSGVMPLFDQALAGYQAEPAQLWRHCLTCALVARRLAQFKNWPPAEAEKEVLGVDHAILGGLAARR